MAGAATSSWAPTCWCGHQASIHCELCPLILVSLVCGGLRGPRTVQIDAFLQDKAWADELLAVVKVLPHSHTNPSCTSCTHRPRHQRSAALSLAQQGGLTAVGAAQRSGAHVLLVGVHCSDAELERREGKRGDRFPGLVGAIGWVVHNVMHRLSFLFSHKHAVPFVHQNSRCGCRLAVARWRAMRTGWSTTLSCTATASRLPSAWQRVGWWPSIGSRSNTSCSHAEPPRFEQVSRRDHRRTPTAD